MNEDREYYINTPGELIDLFAKDVINHRLFTDNIIEAIAKQVRECVEESIRTNLKYEINDINWISIANDLGHKGPVEISRIMRDVTKQVVTEVMVRHEFVEKTVNNQRSCLPETTLKTNKKLQVLCG